MLKREQKFEKLQSCVSQDAFVLKIQRELCHRKWPRTVSGLSRNALLILVVSLWVASISNNTDNEDHEESSKPSQRGKNKTRDRDVETLRLES